MSLNSSFGQKNGLYVNDVKELELGTNNKEEANDIFNSIPMEINEDNSIKEYYNYLYLKEKINYNLNNLFNYINRKLKNKQMKFLFALKQKSNAKYSKLINAEILYMSIESNLKLLEHIWHTKRLDTLNYILSKIKNYIILNTSYKDYDSKKIIEIKKNINRINEDYKKIDKKYKDKAGEIDKLKKEVEIQKKEMDEIKKKNKNLEEGYNILIGKNNELKEIISLSRQKSAKYNYENDTDDEKRILELQNKIKIKEKESNKELEYYELFYNEMNEMLSQYESKYDTIKSNTTFYEVIKTTNNTTNQNV